MFNRKTNAVETDIMDTRGVLNIIFKNYSYLMIILG
jgi:hypothetical protein